MSYQYYSLRNLFVINWFDFQPSEIGVIGRKKSNKEKRIKIALNFELIVQFWCFLRFRVYKTIMIQYRYNQRLKLYLFERFWQLSATGQTDTQTYRPRYRLLDWIGGGANKVKKINIDFFLTGTKIFECSTFQFYCNNSEAIKIHLAKHVSQSKDAQKARYKVEQYKKAMQKNGLICWRMTSTHILMIWHSAPLGWFSLRVTMSVSV